MTIMVGIDMHVKTLVCEIGYNKKKPIRKIFKNNAEGHKLFIEYIRDIKDRINAQNILVAYEASGLGYVLYDKLNEIGYKCVILAPTELLRSATGFKKKTDKKDASYIYETVRGHVLAGNRLKDIWVPDKELREDRDVVRTRFDIAKKITGVKVQIQTLLKKYGIKKDVDIENWSVPFRKWLEDITSGDNLGFNLSLNSLIRQLQFLESECKLIDNALKQLSMKDRYKNQCGRLLMIKGVGLMTAMTFLTEIGDVTRFNNRKQLGAYLGLVPSSFESGDAFDRKGRITRNGPYRLRSILNQSVWIHLRYNGEERKVYDRIVIRNPKRKKKAVVACMRRLGIRLWHETLESLKEVELAKAA